MKTFKQFIQEARTETLEDFLAENCHHLMSAIDGDVDDVLSPKLSLYRGINISSAKKVTLMLNGKPINGYIKTVRTDRKPLDTHPQISKLVDDIFEKEIGWRPRSQGIFCFNYAYRGGSSDYGENCRIYPMGPFEFVYSKKIKDLTPMVGRLLPGHKDKDEVYSQKVLDATKDLIAHFINTSDYTTNDLYDALTTSEKPEIMIKCSTYLAIPVGYFFQ